jgi:hypothetical protein
VGYVVHRGLPFLDYRADVEIEPLEAGGSAIHWHCSFQPQFAGTGWLCRAFMRYVLSSMVAAVARHAEELESGQERSG